MLPLGDIIRIILHGVLQKILLLLPVVKPLQESTTPPGWWYAFFGWAAWYYNLDADRRPNAIFIDNYLYCGWGWLKKLAVHESEQFTLAVRGFLISVIGSVLYGFSSVSAWLNNVDLKVGWVLPSWAASAAAGLWKLFHWLPPEIREWGWTWVGIWDRVKDQAIAIAHSLFDRALDWGWEAVQWVWHTGGHLRTWWLAVANFVWWLWTDFYGAIISKLGSAWFWLLDFRNNAKTWIINWLSPWWPRLVTFASSALDFYYNLWGSHAQRLSEFLSSPLDYFYDRAESFIERKLG